MRRTTVRKGDRGFVIALALIALLVMTFFLLTGAATTTSTVKIAGNYAKTVNIFNIAEAGLAKARPLIENKTFDQVLTQYQSGPATTGSFNGGTYRVTIANDPGDAGGALHDTNGIIKVVSEGSNPAGGKVTIETYVQLISETVNSVELPDSPGGGESAGLMCGAQSDVKVQGTTAMINGDDYATKAVLEGLIPCSGAGCNVVPTGTTNQYDIISQGPLTCQVLGGGSCGVNQQNVGSDANCDEWTTLYQQLASLSTNAPGVVVLSGTEYNGDTQPDVPCTEPKVFIINTNSPTFTFKGDVGLCGTFVVATNTSIEMNGTVTLVGLMLMMGTSSNLSYSGTSGTSNFYGKMVFNSQAVDTQKELYIKGNAKILYSSAGVGFGLEAINGANQGGGGGGGGRLLTAAWNEIY